MYAKVPDTLSLAVSITLFLGVATILLVYHLLRSALELEIRDALLITAFYAFHPLTLVYSSRVMTDIPFSALCLAALLGAGIAIRSPQKSYFIALSALFVNSCILMRLAGIAICVG